MIVLWCGLVLSESARTEISLQDGLVQMLVSSSSSIMSSVQVLSSGDSLIVSIVLNDAEKPSS